MTETRECLVIVLENQFESWQYKIGTFVVENSTLLIHQVDNDNIVKFVYLIGVSITIRLFKENLVLGI
jgi:hypothetical protein